MKNIYRLQINSRLGHFNLMDTSEESIRTAFNLYKNDIRIGYASIETEYEIDEGNFESKLIGIQCAEAIEEYEKKLWISSNRGEALEFAKLLRKKNNAIVRGNREYDIKILLAKKESIEKQLKA